MKLFSYIHRKGCGALVNVCLIVFRVSLDPPPVTENTCTPQIFFFVSNRNDNISSGYTAIFLQLASLLNGGSKVVSAWSI